MEKVILYHGSNVEVRNPRIINTNKGLDFGSGFYVTSDMKQAKRWSILTINDYISGAIPAKTALILLEPANLTDQYAFLTHEGIQTLKFKEAITDVR